MSVYSASIGTVRCSSCHFGAELLTSEPNPDIWSQLAGFLDCNGCPECPGELELIRAGFIDLTCAWSRKSS